LSPIQGELVEVNAVARTFSVLASDKAKVQFLYTEKTEVTGAKEGVAGLATMKGARVTVHFTEATNIKTATRIQVEPRQADAPPAPPAAPPAAR
jgi:hypothetical protein